MLLPNHRGPVLTAVGFVNEKWQFSTTYRIEYRHPTTDHQKIVIGDYVGNKFGVYPSTGA